MARRKKSAWDLATARGVFDDEGSGNSWWMTLIQVPGPAGSGPAGPVDLDAIVSRLIAGGVVGEHRRDVGSALRASTIPTPSGAWALLVALRGQAWAYLTPSDYGTPRDLARRAGLRTLGAGYQDTANATAFEAFEGTEALVEFESCGMSGGDEDAEDEEFFSETRFTGSRLPADWLRQFASEDAVQQALAREFDAYVPALGASGYGSGGVQLSGYGADGVEFAADDYARVDLIGFGATRLEPEPAGYQLREAILTGDLAGIRLAVAAGADLRTLPGLKVSPLTLAVGVIHGGGPRPERVATLLALGADPTNPGGETPLHIVLDQVGLAADPAELIATLTVLLDRGVPVDEPGRELLTQGLTPLHLAARRRLVAVAKFLISRGADLGATGGHLGQTPRQVAEGVAELMLREFGRNEPNDAAMVDLLAAAEAGRADLDLAWQADAEAAQHAAERQQRRMKVAMGRIRTGFQALQALEEAAPTPQAIVNAAIFTQPDEIHLESIPAPRGKNLRTALRPALDAAGFGRFGSYRMAELPKIRLDAYHNPTEHLVAIHYDAAGRSILDLVRYHNDATRLTVTNNETPPEVHFEMPDRRTIRLPGGTLADLLAAARADTPPPAGVHPIAPAEFVARFEDSYRREIRARKRTLRHSGSP